jgi:hypothetical protein
MAVLIYPQGIPSWPGLNDVDYRWMLLVSSYVPDPSIDQFVADIAAHEATDSSYARVTLTGATQTVTSTSVDYDADDPAFGNLVGGETLAWAVLFEQVTSDADSPLMAAYRIAKVTDGSPVTVVLDPAGLCSFTQGV